MKISRRAFTLGSSMAMAATALPLSRARAQATAEMGAMRIDIVSDGYLTLPRDFILGELSEEALAPILAEAGVGPGALTPPCNVTLLRHEDRVILFDVGSGTEFQPTAGLLPETLEALGLYPEDITHLVFTHGHPDHLWGVLDDFGDSFLPNAEILMGQAEFDYWMDANTVSTIGQARQAFAVGAQRRLEALADMITFFGDGEEILPGVAARATFGHSPGHMAFELRDGSESLMVVGDSLGNHHVAFAKPDWITGSDQDGAMAAQTRVGLLDQITDGQMRIAGFHLPGGLGHVERRDDGYRFVAEA
ncbi:MAG: MBL fold metallo-hydrolase [Rhodobacter sp.]|nr:MBL fold metallo-hydrolase [Rhodobacter sp.]